MFRFDDVGHRVAVHLAADGVGSGTDSGEVGAAGAEQGGDLGLGQVLAGAGAVEDRLDGRPAAGAVPVAVAVRGSAGRPRDRVQHFAGWRRLVAGRPLVRARQAGGVNPLQHRGADTAHAADVAALAAAVVEPAFATDSPLRVDGQPLDQGLAGGGGLFGQAFEVRPGRLRVDEVRGDRRHAAPVVDAGGDELRQDARAQIRRRLDVHLGSEHEARRGDSSTAGPRASARARPPSGSRAWPGSSG